MPPRTRKKRRLDVDKEKVKKSMNTPDACKAEKAAVKGNMPPIKFSHETDWDGAAAFLVPT